MDKTVALAWNGDIGSTALAACLAQEGFQIQAVHFGQQRPQRIALEKLLGPISTLAQRNGGSVTHVCQDAHISNDPKKVHRMIDFLAGNNVGVGVRERKARELAAYYCYEYGSEFALISPSTFSMCASTVSDLVGLGFGIIGGAMFNTYTCNRSGKLHCGACHKCLQRHAAFLINGIPDQTEYEMKPKDDPIFDQFLKGDIDG